jgi:hypothetical protein
MAKLLAMVMVLGLGCGDDVNGTGGAGGVAGSGGAGGMAGSGGAGGMAGSGGAGGMAGTGGTGGVDAPMMIDAPTDGAMGGADASATACVAYCDCMVNGNCQGSANGFNNVGQCETACALLNASQVNCRDMQCNNAGDPAAIQCQHAVGMGAGIPAECR